MAKHIIQDRIILTLCFSLMVLALSFGLNSCQPQPTLNQESSFKVVATTSLVGDVVTQIGGDKISLRVLLPLGTDPHSFSPTPSDASALVDANLIFANGAGLEEFLNYLLENVGGSDKVVEVSKGIKFRTIIDEDSGSNKPVDDPHTWMDPNNVIVWVENIVGALSELDPENAAYYQGHGQSYQAKLIELDGWIRSQVSQIPLENRKIVTEHLIFGYFTDRYGFAQIGAIIPGFSSLAEPSARDIAQIEDEIHSLGVKAIFLSVGVNENFGERIADDTGTKLVFLYMHSLSGKGGLADNYIDFMRYDVMLMVEALK